MKNNKKRGRSLKRIEAFENGVLAEEEQKVKKKEEKDYKVLLAVFTFCPGRQKHVQTRSLSL